MAMSMAVTIVKAIGCWFCIVAAVALLVLGHEPFGIAGVLALIAIAFAQAPNV
jgi:hypothetical protein